MDIESDLNALCIEIANKIGQERAEGEGFLSGSTAKTVIHRNSWQGLVEIWADCPMTEAKLIRIEEGLDDPLVPVYPLATKSMRNNIQGYMRGNWKSFSSFSD